MSLTTLGSLEVLDLSNNLLTGDVPVNGSFSLFTPSCFENKPCLNLNQTSTPAAPLPPPQKGKSATGASAGGVAAGAAPLFAAPAIALAYWRRRKLQDYFLDVPAEEDLVVHLERPESQPPLDHHLTGQNESVLCWDLPWGLPSCTIIATGRLFIVMSKLLIYCLMTNSRQLLEILV